MNAVENDLARYQALQERIDADLRRFEEGKQQLWDTKVGNLYDRLGAIPGAFLSIENQARRTEMITQIEEIVADAAAILEEPK